MERRTFLWAAVILYAAVIFLLSSSSNPPSDENFGFSIPFFDKIAHFFIYLIFGFLIYRALKESEMRPAGFLAYLFGTLYAFSDEIHQYFVPNRCTDPLDFMVDILAISLAIGLSVIERPIKWK